jgi:hypothetical protein
LRWRGRARADNHFNFFFWGGGGLTLAFYGWALLNKNTCGGKHLQLH